VEIDAGEPVVVSVFAMFLSRASTPTWSQFTNCKVRTVALDTRAYSKKAMVTEVTERELW